MSTSLSSQDGADAEEGLRPANVATTSTGEHGGEPAGDGVVDHAGSDIALSSVGRSAPESTLEDSEQQGSSDHRPQSGGEG